MFIDFLLSSGSATLLLLSLGDGQRKGKSRWQMLAKEIAICQLTDRMTNTLRNTVVLLKTQRYEMKIHCCNNRRSCFERSK